MALKGFLHIILARLMEVIDIKPMPEYLDIGLNKRALIYITQNFKDSNLSLETMAEDLQINVNQLSKLFAQKIGIKYNDYLNMFRIRYAQQQMKSTELNITEIAYESGFDSIRTFNRVFKNVNGMTPGEYRRKNGQKP